MGRLAILGVVGALLGCRHLDRHAAVDMAMTSAYRPPVTGLAATGDAKVSAAHGAGGAVRVLRAAAPAPLRLLAGDFHCHVSPPDWDQEATRDVAGTVALARAEHLDFVVLTPHVRARFFVSEPYRRAELAALSDLRDEIAQQGSDAPLLIPGFEYTDHRQGHLGFSFADLDQLLARLSIYDLQRRPQDFVSGWVAAGGLVVLNHPLVTPLDSMLEIGRVDLSWRPWTRTRPGPFPPEIEAANRLAQGVEAYNLTAAHLRDRYLSHPGPGTYADTLARVDDEILAQQRRLVPLGGSDSHENHLRATTFVLATARTAEAIRDAVLAGRVCVRDGRACSLEARMANEPWQPVGAAFSNAPRVDVRATGDEIKVLVNGRLAAQPHSGEVASLPLDPSRCSIIRAEIDGGAAAPIYANCPFALQARAPLQ